MQNVNFPFDANFNPIGNFIPVKSTVTYAAATTGAQGAHTLFTITGPCIVKLIGYCSTGLDSDGAATIEVGITGALTTLCAQVTATDIDTGEFYIDNSPATNESDFTGKIIATDIVETIGTTTIKSGVIDWICLWLPLESTSTIVATTPA
jgi:hypothetical protein